MDDKISGDAPGHSHAPAPAEKLAQMISGYVLSRAIYVAAKLEIADRLVAGPVAVSELARQSAMHPEALYRVLRALASVGIFTEVSPQSFGLTPLAEYLRRDVPGSMWAMTIMQSEHQWRAWDEILYCVETSKPGFEKVYGQPVFERLKEHPDEAAVFDQAMTGIHGAETLAMLDHYDFSGIHTLADVGGGNGSLLIATLQRYPQMRGMLYDLPHVVERAEANFKAAGLSDRAQLEAGSFFESVPSGADAYLMRHIIHDWYDEQAMTILRNCRRAIPDTGKLLLVESVIPPGDAPSGGKFLDLTMLVVPGGKERTAGEYRQLLADSGFELQRIVPISREMSVIESLPQHH